MKKVIVSVAPVANPAAVSEIRDMIKNPISPEEVAKEVISCAEAGASMVHLHVRDCQANITSDLSAFSRTLDLIRKRSDIIIQGSTGGVSDLTLEERCVALNDPRLQVASLNMGSVNFGEGVYINTLPDIRYWAGRMQKAQVQPELEIFEAGMINNVKILTAEGILQSPHIFAFCLGVTGALPSEPGLLYFLKHLLPPDSTWGVIHHGMTDLSLLAAAISLGAGIVRVGYEDSVFYAPGKIARTNAELVEKIVALINNMGYSVATPKEAAKILGIKRCL